jgi:hypothetical protein
LWLQKTQPDKPWALLPIQMCPVVNAFFSIAVNTEIGDGSNTLFWKDRWLSGQRIEDLAPTIFKMVPKRIANSRSVQEALLESRWIRGIHGEAMVLVLTEFLELWDIISGTPPQQDVPDTHVRQWSSSSKYTAKSAYDALRQGSIRFGPWRRIWKTWAPRKCHFFLWLAAHDRCWIADRLARRNLPHPQCCLLCDQEEETINHLLSSCVFARQFWFLLLR